MTTYAERVESDYPQGYLELIDRSERICQMPTCRQAAIFRAVDFTQGRPRSGGWYCGFHGSALYGRRLNGG